MREPPDLELRQGGYRPGQAARLPVSHKLQTVVCLSMSFALADSSSQMQGWLTNVTKLPRPALWPEGLCLRHRRDRDLEGLFALFRQDDFQQHASTMEPLASQGDVSAYLASLAPFSCELVAEIAGTVVGHAIACPLSGRQKHTGTLTLYVHEAYRHQGIGIALMRCLILTAKAMMGLKRLQLTVFVDNVRAIALYRRFGFQIEGRIRDFVERPDGLIDAYLMALLDRARLPLETGT